MGELTIETKYGTSTEGAGNSEVSNKKCDDDTYVYPSGGRMFRSKDNMVLKCLKNSTGGFNYEVGCECICPNCNCAVPDATTNANLCSNNHPQRQGQKSYGAKIRFSQEVNGNKFLSQTYATWPQGDDLKTAPNARGTSTWLYPTGYVYNQSCTNEDARLKLGTGTFEVMCNKSIWQPVFENYGCSVPRVTPDGTCNNGFGKKDKNDKTENATACISVDQRACCSDDDIRFDRCRCYNYDDNKPLCCDTPEVTAEKAKKAAEAAAKKKKTGGSTGSKTGGSSGSKSGGSDGTSTKDAAAALAPASTTAASILLLAVLALLL